MTSEQQVFIMRIAATAQACYKRFRILPSLVIAMAIKESNWGRSQLAAKNFNYFGMKWTTKCGTKWVEYNTKEWDKTAGKYVTVKAKFRSFDNMTEGLIGFYNFITGYKRYANLIGETNPVQACIKIQQDGWATSPTYADSLYHDYIEKYDLTKYDDPDTVPEDPEIKPYYIKGKVYKLEVNLYIRQTPEGVKKKMFEITANAKVNSYVDSQGNAILKAGTRVTCLDIAHEGNNTWILIPSGWICAVYRDKIYVGGA